VNSSRRREPPVAGSASDTERVCLVVARIPRGTVATYGQVAELAGLPRGARKVGRIMSQLPRGSRIPWHRVVNAAGRISLPKGAGYERQRRALEREGVVITNGRLSLARHRWRP
jgi:methylated-DNA-protein-cysteine methyltransferase-like protein